MNKGELSAAESGHLSPSEVHRKIIEFANAGQLDDAILLIATDAIDHLGGQIGDQKGRDLWRQKWDKTASIPFHLTIAVNISQGDISVNRYRIRTVDPKSGKSLEADGIDMIRVRDGQIVEHWAFMDTAALFPRM
jgi:predicted SnoaL-like aldol condensation-catalyzing enzyme